MAVVLCVFTACREEVVLEEGVMRPKDFFSEIKISPKDLKEGWWMFGRGIIREDVNGNFKHTSDDWIIGFWPDYDYIYYVQDGRVVDAKTRESDFDDWVENEDFIPPVDIAFNKKDRSLSCPINEYLNGQYNKIFKADEKQIYTLTDRVLVEDEKNDRTYYLFLILSYKGKDLPPKKHWRYDDDGNRFYDGEW